MVMAVGYRVRAEGAVGNFESLEASRSLAIKKQTPGISQCSFSNNAPLTGPEGAVHLRLE
jgi:hypothetical protein